MELTDIDVQEQPQVDLCASVDATREMYGELAFYPEINKEDVGPFNVLEFYRSNKQSDQVQSLPRETQKGFLCRLGRSLGLRYIQPVQHKDVLFLWHALYLQNELFLGEHGTMEFHSKEQAVRDRMTREGLLCC